MVQALSLWTDFERTLRGEHNYGGEVAEVYVYRLMSRSPMAEEFLKKPRTAPRLMAEEGRKAIRDANESFHNLLAHFAQEREALVEVEHDGGAWVELGDWLKTWNQAHRWHVRIRPRK